MNFNDSISNFMDSLDSFADNQNANLKRRCNPKCYKIYECDCHDDCKDPCEKPCHEPQTHVHEFLGSTQLADYCGGIHNHRFAGVTSQAIPTGNSHVHRISINTDYFSDHFHGICIITGPAIDVGGGKHVHLVTGYTTCEENHKHRFIFTTLIENPLQQ